MTLVDNILETDTIRVTVHANGFTELLIKNDATFDTKDIIQSKNFIIGILKDKKAYILVEAAGDIYTNKEARDLAASPEHSTHHGAVAICSDKLAYKILGSLYIKVNKPNVPTKFFNKRNEAVDWLNTFIK